MSDGRAVNAIRFALLLAAAALLHLPVVLTRANASRGRAPTLPDGTVSFACYGVLDRPGETRAVRVGLRAGQELAVELLVPALPPERDLPEADLPSLAVTTPSGTREVLRASRRETFDDPHSATSYLSYLTGRFPAGEGTCTLTVSGPAPARFVLVVGDQERPGEVLGASIGSLDDVLRWYRAEPDAPS